MIIEQEATVNSDLVTGEVKALVKRGITEQTCAKWGYKVGTYQGKSAHIAPYYKQGKVVAQKLRFPNKEFRLVGDTKDLELFGQSLWRDGGKMVVVTEGEIDALSVSQIQGNKWPVVSVPNGAQGAAKAVARNLDYLMGFEKVIFLFDNDDPGHKAAQECAALLPPGKAYIGSLPLKDANEMLVAGRGPEVVDAIWGAKAFRPDGIVSAADTWVAVNEDRNVQSYLYPWKGLQDKTYGLRRGELVTFTAGSGIGKSLVCREIAHHLLKRGETVGYVALEESIRRTVLGLMSIELSKPLHLNREGLTDEQFRRAWDAVTAGNHLYLYDHFGSLESQNLLARLRYLARGCNAGWLVLDHISIVVSGMGDGDERRLIDNTMTALRSLVEETGVGLILVSHLKRPEGNKGHEEGQVTSLSQLRGSHAIAQLSDMVVGLERNQQDPEAKDTTTVRVLKNRYSGDTGVACYLRYNRETGRLYETGSPDEGPIFEPEEEF
jgi:twinkle protein